MKTIINTNKAPAPVGPYNQAVAYGNTVYISGQIAIDPVTGKLVTDNIEDETHQIMRNLAAILAAAELDFEHVLKASVFVKDMTMYSRINEVYAQYFDKQTAPARELVQVAALPKFVNVEISVIAGK